MLFKYTLIQKIVLGQKTQTRRPVKAGDEFASLPLGEWDIKHVCVTHNGRIKWVVGRHYAVQPKRGDPGMCYGLLPMGTPIPDGKCNDDLIRIRITNIRREDVRLISLADAKAEGFEDEIDFWLTWCGFYDKKLEFNREKAGRFVDVVKRPVAEVRRELLTRPAALYDAAALTFRVEA